MPECDCGAFVTSAFVRVFAPDNAETVEKCLECAGKNGIMEGI